VFDHCVLCFNRENIKAFRRIKKQEIFDPSQDGI